MVVDSSVYSDFNVVSGDSIQSVDIDDVGLHVDNMNSVSKGIEVLQT